MLRFAFELIASGILEHVISSSDGDFLSEPIPSDVSGYLDFSWPPGVKQDLFRMLIRVQSLPGVEGRGEGRGRDIDNTTQAGKTI